MKPNPRSTAQLPLSLERRRPGHTVSGFSPATQTHTYTDAPLCTSRFTDPLAMRFQDWDVLLFPTGPSEPRVPLQEFRVNCHLAPESLLIQTPFPVDTPIMTCFVPSLPVGAPFHISISSWKAPEASHHTLTTYGMPDLVRFEVTVLFDGVPVA